MEWNRIVEIVMPNVVRIETPQGHGSGYIFACNADQSLIGIATAAHVIEHADRWAEPFRVWSPHLKWEGVITARERVINSNPLRDSASIVVSNPFKEFSPRVSVNSVPHFAEATKLLQGQLEIGTDVGWIGFPYAFPETACFFSGKISAHQGFHASYLIDGVSINGVSGGPVFCSTSKDGIQLVGIISAYMPNRATGEALPGLAIARDVSEFHGFIVAIKSLEDAIREKAEE